LNLLQLGDRYSELREEKELSISQLSKKINCNPKTISFYENGSRSMPSNVVIKYADFFNVSTDYLLGISDYRHKINFEFDYQARVACEYTGLSFEEISNIKLIKQNDIIRDYLLKTFLSNEYSVFNALADTIKIYVDDNSNIDNETRDYVKWRVVRVFEDTLDYLIQDIKCTEKEKIYNSAIKVLNNRINDNSSNRGKTNGND